MKSCDIKRLEKVVQKYKEIEEILDKVYYSTEIHDDIFTFLGICPTSVSVCSLIKDMCVSAAENRKYIEGKIRAFNDCEI